MGTEEEGHTKIHELLLPLERLPAVLCQMTNLATFSFYIHSRYGPNRGTIGSILQSLPESCVNLELDLERPYNRLGTVSNHVCEVAKRLPRLHHLRLELDTLCPDMFGPGFSRSGFINDEAQFRASTYPALRTLIINCGFMGDTLTCNEDRSQPPSESGLLYPRVRTTLVNSLRELVLRGAFPNIERLWVVDGTVQNDWNEREYSAWNRRDVAGNKTWAIPWISLDGGKGFPVLIARFPDGQELITKRHPQMRVLVEGQTWKETITGTRLPAAVSDDLEKGKHLMKSATISLSEYRKINPRGSCTWWINDAKTGTTTVSAEEREGLEDRSLVLATTPSGWTWKLRDGMPRKLVRETSAT